MDFLSILITTQSVIAVAEHRRRGCPVRQPSPKKSPSFRMPMVASLPIFETTVSFTFPFCITAVQISRDGSVGLKKNGAFLVFAARFQVEVAILLSKLGYQESGICSAM